MWTAPPSLHHYLHRDLKALESELTAKVPPRTGPAEAAARHLLGSPGKRARPLLCHLAARVPPPHHPIREARALACAAELVHGATLLHDDVLDEGQLRRGRPTARAVHGNAASVLGGDLLLVEALELIAATGTPVLLASMLAVLREMIAAESLQLELRGKAARTEEQYFAIARGKTASLFRWSLEAGATAGGAETAIRASLGRFGAEVGVAFQLADDLLDVCGDPERVGKAVLRDVELGAANHPVTLALDGRPELATRMVTAARGAADPSLGADVRRAAQRCGAVARTRAVIAEHTARALAAVGELPPSPAREALESAAHLLGERAA